LLLLAGYVDLILFGCGLPFPLSRKRHSDSARTSSQLPKARQNSAHTNLSVATGDEET